MLPLPSLELEVHVARLVGALAMVSLGLVVLGAAGLVVRIGRTLDGARDAIGSITPSITTHRETDAALEVADAGAWSARPPERPSASRARTEPVIAATQEAETLLEAMTGRLRFAFLKISISKSV